MCQSEDVHLPIVWQFPAVVQVGLVTDFLLPVTDGCAVLLRCTVVARHQSVLRVRVGVTPEQFHFPFAEMLRVVI